MIVSIHPTIHISQLSSLIKLQTSAQLSMRRDSYIKTRYTYFCIYHVYYDLKYRRGFIYRRDNIIMISIHSSHIPSTFLLPSVLQFQFVRTWSKICNEVNIRNKWKFWTLLHLNIIFYPWQPCCPRLLLRRRWWWRVSLGWILMPTCCLLSLFEWSWSQLLLLHLILLTYSLWTPLTETLLLLMLSLLWLFELK